MKGSALKVLGCRVPSQGSEIFEIIHKAFGPSARKAFRTLRWD